MYDGVNTDVIREILFRGCDKTYGIWVYGDLVRYAGGCQIWQSNRDGGKYNYIVDPTSIGQYTGLTDKNGVKVFEGDIVSTAKYGKENGGCNYNGSDTFRVVYEDGGYCLRTEWRRFNLRPDDGMVVIGNIYDAQTHEHGVSGETEKGGK